MPISSPKIINVKFPYIKFPFFGDAILNGIFLVGKSLKIGDRGFEIRSFGFTDFKRNIFG